MKINEKNCTIYAELLEAQMDRQNGYQGRNARNVHADMKRIIAETEIMLEYQP